jgi:uncharacterized heparinase superfamily protein
MEMMIVFHSLRYLKPSMICWRVVRTVKGAAIGLIERGGMARALFDRPVGTVAVSPVPRLTGRYHCEDIDLDARRLSFLRDAAALPTDPAVLRAAVARKPLLWQFHFGYHDYLLALLDSRRDGYMANEVLDFITLWSAAFPLHAAGSRRSAWHPYVLSIRIESWVRLHAMLIECGFPDEDLRLRLLREGVERMTRVLLRNLEKGTMANHLLRNIKALVFAGLYLDTATGAQARRIGLKLLDRELAEQILDDGCHFERSPMYHVSVLNDVLDMAEAMLLCGSTVPDRLSVAATRMTEFLERMRHPDGEIPYFNDSTGSFFLRTAEVLARGRRLAGELREPDGREPDGREPEGREPEIAEVPASGNIDPRRVSGLLVAETSRAWLVMDGGLVGPDYQPGHAHCDTLSFELSLDGARFVTDTGVFHYRESPERSYSRSTAAHNTIEIDGAEQSEIWKSFRVGRRAKILHLSTERREGLRILRAAHDGYTRLQRGLFHERAILLAEDWLLIVDWLHGSGAHSFRSFLHFHPAVTLHASGSAEFSAVREECRARVRVQESEHAGIVETEYYPAFGEKRTRQSLVCEGEGSLPRVRVTAIEFGTAAPDHEIDGMKIRLPGFGEVEPAPRL